MIIVEQTDPRGVGPRALLAQSHALMQALSPPEDNYYLEIDELCAPDVHFLAARKGIETVGTGALKFCDGYAEVKSMFVAESARGQGVADAILRALEDEARARGVPCLRLETSASLLPHAMKLYERHGFFERGIFGDYRPNETNTYMEKLLPPAEPS